MLYNSKYAQLWGKLWLIMPAPEEEKEEIMVKLPVTYQ